MHKSKGKPIGNPIFEVDLQVFQDGLRMHIVHQNGVTTGDLGCHGNVIVRPREEPYSELRYLIGSSSYAELTIGSMLLKGIRSEYRSNATGDSERPGPKRASVTLLNAVAALAETIGGKINVMRQVRKKPL